MSHILDAIFQRRAVKVFDPVEIALETREEMFNAARVAPSSFNIQPYRFYWIESPEARAAAARLCMNQSPAATASALVVAVADLGSWKSTNDSYLEWMRATGFTPEKIRELEKKSKWVKWFFIQGWFGSVGAAKWGICRLVNIWMTIGFPPVARQGMFKWAIKSASLACQNLMIAAEALGLNTCPMEGFDGRRLSKFLGLSSSNHDIVMVIAVGRKSARHADQPQWRRPLEATVKIL